MSHRKSSTTKKLLASLAILAAVGVFVSYGVFSSFSSTTNNTSNLKSATFSVDQAPAGFLQDVLNLIPGDTLTRCVTITNNSSIPVDVTAMPSVTDVDATNPLSAVLKVKLIKVSGLANATGSCAGAVPGTPVINDIVGSALDTTNGYAAGSLTTSGASQSQSYEAILTLPTVGVGSTYAGKQSDVHINFVASQQSGAERSS